jgi:hypothetical protein
LVSICPPGFFMSLSPVFFFSSLSVFLSIFILGFFSPSPLQFSVFLSCRPPPRGCLYPAFIRSETAPVVVTAGSNGMGSPI